MLIRDFRYRWYAFRRRNRQTILVAQVALFANLFVLALISAYNLGWVR